MKLESADIILYVNDRKDWFSTFKRWASGRYEHVSMYIGKFHDIPMLYESDGRGVVIQNVAHQTGRSVVIMRPEITQIQKNKVIKTAFDIASSDKSYYDYFAIVKSAIPRLLKEKFSFLPVPSQYIRDAMMICSEATAEPFWRNGIEILPQDVIPLPIDYYTSPILKYVCEGKLLEDIVG